MLRSNWTAGLGTALATSVALALASPAAADTVYEWVTEDGTYAYSDSFKRIPERYQDAAEKRTLGKLSRYERWTPSDRKAEGAYTDRLAENLERLRELNAPPSAPVALPVPAGGGNKLILRSGRNGNQGFEFALGADRRQGPLVIENLRTRAGWGLDNTTRHVTVVRRGDAVLAVIKPHLNSQRLGQIPTLEEATSPPFVGYER